MRRTQLTMTAMTVASLLAFTGCGGKKEASNNKPAPTAKNSAPAQANQPAKSVNAVPSTGPQVTAAKQRLVGEWHGQMEVNAQKVAETLRAKQVDQVNEEMIQRAIATLQSLKMNINFRHDGAMKLAASLTEQGKQTEAKGDGKWQLLHVDRNDILIRSIEEGKDPEDVQIHFEGDNEFSMQPPKEYAGIGMMRFRRIR